jgi:hypothetical protein
LTRKKRNDGMPQAPRPQRNGNGFFDRMNRIYRIGKRQKAGVNRSSQRARRTTGALLTQRGNQANKGPDLNPSPRRQAPSMLFHGSLSGNPNGILSSSPRLRRLHRAKDNRTQMRRSPGVGSCDGLNRSSSTPLLGPVIAINSQRGQKADSGSKGPKNRQHRQPCISSPVGQRKHLQAVLKQVHDQQRAQRSCNRPEKRWSQGHSLVPS